MIELRDIKDLLRDSLQLGARADVLTADSGLLGAIPEFDSMAVVAIIGLMEERFEITVEDDEMNAEIFTTVGTLADFIKSKTNS
jgi:acyl carrier protein